MHQDKATPHIDPNILVLYTIPQKPCTSCAGPLYHYGTANCSPFHEAPALRVPTEGRWLGPLPNLKTVAFFVVGLRETASILQSSVFEGRFRAWGFALRCRIQAPATPDWNGKITYEVVLLLVPILKVLVIKDHIHIARTSMPKALER